ncbi:TMhelix containing protein [Vibrio phage 1.223.O._10N.261.48.A9]|nr:TMhelix containing protein [Vibrio phage 1.223.O._10N.261.48.A9]
MKKPIKLTLVSLTLLTPIIPLSGYSAFASGAYLAYWVAATALAGRLIFRKEINNAN